MDEILKKLQSLPKEYWIEVYEKLDGDRQVKIDDLMALLTFLFANAEKTITNFVGLYLIANDNNIDYVVNNKRISSAEVRATKALLTNIANDLKAEGLELDKDIELEIESLNTRTTQLENLKIKIRTYLNELYVRINNEVTKFLGTVIEDFHDHTIYEVFKAAGKGSKDYKPLDDETLQAILALYWRATEETFDDAIWRYGRSFIVELEQLFGRSTLINMSAAELEELIAKMFRNKYNELKKLINTDATFFSTKGETRAFEELMIEEAVFTAILDERTSDFCREADGNVIPVEAIVPWENAPPLHYYCRSTMIPIVKNINFLTGETYEMENLKFDGWYEKYFAV